MKDALFFPVNPLCYLLLAILGLSGCSDSGSSNNSSSVSIQLSVDGNGYLILQSGPGELVYVRTAELSLDDGGQLATEDGLSLQVFLSTGTGIGVGGTPGALQVTTVDSPTELSISSVGEIRLPDQQLVGQVALAGFATPYHLMEVEEAQWAATAKSGEPVVAAPKTGALGNVVTGAFTPADVDLGFEVSAAPNYFVLREGETELFSDTAFFLLSAEGTLVDEMDRPVQGYPSDIRGEVFNEELQALKQTLSDLAPNPTAKLMLELYVNENEPEPSQQPFDPGHAASYNLEATKTIYDSRGQAHSLSLYFVKTNMAPVWQMHAYITDGDGLTASVISATGGADGVSPFFELTFGSETVLTNPGVLVIDAWNPAGALQSSSSGLTANVGVSDFEVLLSLAMESSREGEEQTTVRSISQDGYPTSVVREVHIDDCGILFGIATFEELKVFTGQLVIARFENPDELVAIDGMVYEASEASGSPDIGVPCENGFPVIVGD